MRPSETVFSFSDSEGETCVPGKGYNRYVNKFKKLSNSFPEEINVVVGAEF